MQEIWKDIPNYEGYYQISNLGNVRGMDRTIISKTGKNYKIKGRLLKKNKKGKQDYLIVNLNKKGKHTSITIHKLVAIAFLNHKPCGFKVVVDHINNIKTDNRVDNLQLISTRMNSCKDKKQKSKHYCIYEVGKSKKYMVRLRINGVKKSLGNYNTISEAISIRDKFIKTEYV